MRRIKLLYTNLGYVVSPIYCDGYNSIGTLKDAAVQEKKVNDDKICEIIIIDVVTSFTREDNYFLRDQSVSDLFLGHPIAIGGNIRNYDVASRIIGKHAERVVINTALSSRMTELNKWVNSYGGQSILPMLDLQRQDGRIHLMKEGCKKICDYTLDEIIANIRRLGIHEIMVRFADIQGTNKMACIDTIEYILEIWDGFLITTGGRFDHIVNERHCHVQSAKVIE